MTVFGSARFRVPEKHGERALEAIRAFTEHVAAEPGTLQYLSLRDRDDPTQFTHWMVFRDEAAEEAHASSRAVGEFTGALYPLCDGPVRFERFELVASAESTA